MNNSHPGNPESASHLQNTITVATRREPKVKSETRFQMVRWSTFLLAFLLAASLTSAQSSASAGQSKTGNKKPAASDKAARDKKDRENERRALAILQVREFAARSSAFQDQWTRSLTTAQLASVLWKHDQPYARQLFTKALDLPVVERGAKPEKNKLTARDVTELRSKVIALIARCDLALAERLTKEDSEEGTSSIDKSQATIENAYEIINDDYKKASDLAASSLKGGVSPYIVQLLKELRRKDEPVANALFLQTLQRLATEPVVDGNTLLLLGTYVFTSPRIDPSEPLAMAMVNVGRFSLPDITAERPGVPLQVARAYLTAAGGILSRHVADPTQKQLYYVAGQLLLPMVQKVAPDLVTIIGAATQARTSDVPPALTNPSAYLQLSNYAPKGFEERLREAEESSNTEEKDLRFFTLAYERWNRHDFTAAHALAAKVSDDNARTQLDVIIDFGEGAQAQEKQDLAGAEAKARKLPQGIERAFLWLAIGDSASRSGDSYRANEYLDEALKAATSVSDARRPFLLLAAASQFTKLDSVRASATLVEAVKEFNKHEDRALARVQWQQKITIGILSRSFPLKAKGVATNFDLALLPFLTDGDTRYTINTVSQLTDERLLGRALVTMATIMLK